MSDYTELVNALRHCVDPDTPCDGCPRSGNNGLCADMLYRDAAAAIEELQDEVKRLEPKLGEWKYIVYHNGCTPDEDIVCSVCGKSGCDNWNYCPNCGAKMEVHE